MGGEVSGEDIFGGTRVSKAWRVSSEAVEIVGPAEMVEGIGATDGILEGVVTNLMTEGVGSWGDFFSASFSAGFSIFIDLKSFTLEEFKELRVNEE